MRDRHCTNFSQRSSPRSSPPSSPRLKKWRMIQGTRLFIVQQWGLRPKRRKHDRGRDRHKSVIPDRNSLDYFLDGVIRIKLGFFTISAGNPPSFRQRLEFEKTLRQVTTISGERYTIGRRKSIRRFKEPTMHVRCIEIVLRMFNYCVSQRIATLLWISNDYALQLLLNRWSDLTR